MRTDSENRPAPDRQRRSGIPAFRRIPVREGEAHMRNDLFARAEIPAKPPGGLSRCSKRAQNRYLQPLVERFGQREHLIRRCYLINAAGTAFRSLRQSHLLQIASRARLRPHGERGRGQIPECRPDFGPHEDSNCRFTSTRCRFTAMASRGNSGSLSRRELTSTSSVAQLRDSLAEWPSSKYLITGSR